MGVLRCQRSCILGRSCRCAAGFGRIIKHAELGQHRLSGVSGAGKFGKGGSLAQGGNALQSGQAGRVGTSPAAHRPCLSRARLRIFSAKRIAAATGA